MSIPCTFCEKRRARRHCPGIDAEICALCCGEARETRVDCPQSCEYLREARFHEVPPPLQEDQVPNKDIRLSEKFIRENEPLIFALAMALKKSMANSGAPNGPIDFDTREALDSMIRTLRTRESGLTYETQPANPYAAAIQKTMTGLLADLNQKLAAETSIPALRDADLLGTLVFLQRLELQYNNGRPRGRAFRDFLEGYVPDASAVGAAL